MLALVLAGEETDDWRCDHCGRDLRVLHPSMGWLPEAAERAVPAESLRWVERHPRILHAGFQGYLDDEEGRAL